MDKNYAKNLIKAAIVIYLASFIIVNWNDVSWIFNYKEVSGIIEDFFNPYPSIDASSMNNYFYPNHSQANIDAGLLSFKTVPTEKQNTLEIPKISLETNIVFPASPEEGSITKDLDSGVVYYPGSVYPGQIGEIVILGHSAPIGWPKIKHDWVFSNLDQLEAGDRILVDLNNKQYTYIVSEKHIIKRGDDVPNSVASGNNNVLTLISCWPPGKDYQRIAVQAELLTN
jgi:LPXTG-site transpeptidase (sortase) family protein